jgi:PAS domain S-box-containing protein
MPPAVKKPKIPGALSAVLETLLRKQQVEARLQVSEALSRSILDSISAAIAVLDEHGVIVAVNESWRRFALENAVEPGTPAPRTDIGTNYLAVCRSSIEHARDDDALAAHHGIQAVLEGRLPSFTFEYPCHSPQQQRWFSMSATPLGPEGRGAVISHTNITARRQAEEALREQTDSQSAVIHSASDAIISVDMDGCISLFNPAAERIFGHEAAAMLGQPLDRLLPERFRARHSADLTGFAQSRVTRRSMGAGRVQGLCANGQEVELEASISQVTVRGRKVLTAILRDVTERVRAEQVRVQYQLELSELTQQLMAQEKATARQLAQTLHDRLGQTLTAIRLSYDSLGIAMEGLMPPPAASRARTVGALIDKAIQEVRQALVQLRPPLLEEQGLPAALDNELRVRSTEAEPVVLRLDIDARVAGMRWPFDVEYAAFMVAREALSNTLQHACASEVMVRLTGTARSLRLEITDDGRGLPADAVFGRPGHLGIVGMRERAMAIGARLSTGVTANGGSRVCLDWDTSP